jgi:aminopeptidase N
MLLRLLIFTLFLSVMNIFAQTPPIETGVSQTLAKWRSANYSDVRYKLNITLEKGAPLMKGTIEISVKLTDEGAKNDLIIDWRTTQFANDKDKPYAKVVTVNEKPISPIGGVDMPNYYVSNEHLGISRVFLKTGENTFKIEFASPIKTSGAAITRYVDKEDGAEYVYSLFVPSDASTAFPVFDQPDLKARFSLSVFITGKNRRDFPNWKVISNGVVSIGFNSTWGTLHTFAETKPISTYVFAFAAGDFVEMSEPSAVADGLASPTRNSLLKSKVSAAQLQPSATADGSDLTMKIYVRTSQAEKFKPHAAETFRLNREGIKYLESYFDYKFPFPKYDLVLIPEFPFGGMEHAGATFLREDRVIFPTEPTKNDFVTRANVIFHEAAHQWFGDTVTMKWFDDLWLKEGFAEFMAYKTLEKVMPEYKAWKIFYERNKQAAYLTDSTKGTTPIYQEIPNLSAAKSAYGNIVYRKAPSFLRQAEFYLGEDKFQTAVRAFLKKHEFANAEWQDLVDEFVEVRTANTKSKDYYQKLSARDKGLYEDFIKWDVNGWAKFWVTKRGIQIIRISPNVLNNPSKLEWGINAASLGGHSIFPENFSQKGTLEGENYNWQQNIKVLRTFGDGEREEATANLGIQYYPSLPDEESKPREEFKFSDKYTSKSEEQRGKEYEDWKKQREAKKPLYVFPNYQDYGYGIFLLDEKSRAYVLANIQNEKDAFLRTMMWGALWDSVRETELAPKDYVELVIKNINVENDESTIQTLLGRVSTAMNYYLSEPSAVADGLTRSSQNSKLNANAVNNKLQPSAAADGSDLSLRLESLLIDKMQNAPTLGQRITFYRAFLNIALGEKARTILKEILNGKTQIKDLKLKTKDRFDIITKLLILADKDAPNLLTELEKMEASDEAKRYAYAAKAGIGTAENKAKFWNDFTNNKEISESYIESAFVAFNSSKHADLTLIYLEKSLAELPNLKRNRKIFFVNGWLSAFIGGQKSVEALAIVNKFLADNPNLDKDLRLKILENVDGLERAVKIRAKYGN